MGLKGYGLWAMGQLDSNVQSPTALLRPVQHRREVIQALAEQVAREASFETTNRIFRFKG
jgi:hypothetical protein